MYVNNIISQLKVDVDYTGSKNEIVKNELNMVFMVASEVMQTAIKERKFLVSAKDKC